jgi:hypothetical protein
MLDCYIGYTVPRVVRIFAISWQVISFAAQFGLAIQGIIISTNKVIGLAYFYAVFFNAMMGVMLIFRIKRE